MPPPYALRDLPAPPAAKEDERVEGGGPYWDLRAIQQALKEDRMQWDLTKTAENDFHSNLKFDDEDMDSLLQILHLGVCRPPKSQWCIEPRNKRGGGKDDRTQHLADVYIIGFNKFTRKEQPGAHPKIYLKFSVSEDGSRLIIYSAHYERQP